VISGSDPDRGSLVPVTGSAFSPCWGLRFQHADLGPRKLGQGHSELQTITGLIDHPHGSPGQAGVPARIHRRSTGSPSHWQYLAAVGHASRPRRARRQAEPKETVRAFL
jgi:hypothetical protein